MTERPILFNARMIRAILSGDKTQTRRKMKPTKEWSEAVINELAPVMKARKWYQAVEMGPCDGVRRRYSCPYGNPGDRLWVRERFRYYYDEPDLWDCIQYADKSLMKPEGLDDYEGHRFSDRCAVDSRWRSPIHMPRWASRITLAITDVRVDLLTSITRDDARAEGVTDAQAEAGDGYDGNDGSTAAFAALWESIYGPDSWTANPWVWVVEFVMEVNSARP